MIIRLSSVVAASLALTLLVPATAAPAAKTLTVKAPPVKLEAVASSMPVWFEPNRGQVGGRTEWTTRAAGAWLFLTSNEVVYALPPDTSGFDPAKTRGVPSFKTTNVHMRMVGGRRVKGVGEGALASYSNYFVGKHEDEWFTGVPHFERVRYAEVYPGIDLIYYATGRSVEYDFLVAPGADPSVIELAFDGVEDVRVDKEGDLIVSAGGKSFRQRRPRVFQGTEEIEASYRMTERGTVKVDVGEFDPSTSLRVDPVLDFATYLGGPGEDGITDIAMAPDGNPVLVGSTQSPQAPTLDPFQAPSIVSLAPIVLKFSPDGKRVLSYSLLGRNGWDSAYAVAVDGVGYISIGGTTRSTEFPLKSAFQSDFRAIYANGFVTRLSPDTRSLIYSSYLGGSNNEQLSSLTLDDIGNAYFAGGTDSRDFPLKDPLQATNAGESDGFISKVSPNGGLLFSTYLGGDGGDVIRGIRWRNNGSLVLVAVSSNGSFPLKDPIQSDASPRIGRSNPVLAIVGTNPPKVMYSTYFGNKAVAAPTALALGSDQKIYVTGRLDERQYPLKDPLFSELAEGVPNSFLTEFDPNGTTVLFSTIVPAAFVVGLAVDSAGNIYVGGLGYAEFALKESLQQFRGGNTDHFLIRIAPGGSRSLAFSTLIGGTGIEQRLSLACSPSGSVYFAGQSGSTDYPTRDAYQKAAGGSNDGIFGRVTDNSIPVLPSFSTTPANLTFRYTQGDSSLPATAVTIGNLKQNVIIQPSAPWLHVTPMALTTAGMVLVSIDANGLAPGIYRGSIAIIPLIGTSAVVEVSLSVLAPAPKVQTLEPARIPIGTGDTEITIRGSGFTSRTTIQVERNPWDLTPVRFIDASTLRFILPRPYLTGEYNFAITVRNPDSATSNAVSLAVGRPAPAISAGGVVSAASFAGQAISPGELVTIFGENFEPGMYVTFDGISAKPLYITPRQMSVSVPYAIAGAQETTVIVESSLERRSIAVHIPVWPSHPGLFTSDSSGRGQGAILNQDGSINSWWNPTAKSNIVVLYGTGGGLLSGESIAVRVKVFIDGIDSEILYAGVAPGLASGVFQINVRVPEFATKGTVVWRVGENESQDGVVVAIK